MLWEDMTPEERKISICEDVLLQLKAEKLNVACGSYLHEIECDQWPLEGSITPQDCDVITESCEVCARGALMLSKIRKYNSVDWDKLSLYDYGLAADQEDTTEILKGAFTEQELLDIEAAFECSQYSDIKYVLFGERYYLDADRLEAIMKNIIKNGYFKVD
jgi:hypothetical protein